MSSRKEGDGWINKVTKTPGGHAPVVRQAQVLAVRGRSAVRQDARFKQNRNRTL
jgi:hypothetical protein